MSSNWNIPFFGQNTLLKNNQSVGDIINAIMRKHNECKNDYDALAEKFNADTTLQIAKNIWEYLRRNIPYVIEPDRLQTVKTPGAIFATAHKRIDGVIGSDCKNYSLFTGGILDAINRKYNKNIKWCYRFASYSLTEKRPGHVFVVINPDDSNRDSEIWIDAVLNRFNYHKYFTYKIDKMSLYSMSGFDDGIGKHKKKKGLFKKLGKGVLKFSGLPARAAFLSLVSLNFLKLGTKIMKARAKDAHKVDSWFKKLGGNPKKLLKSATKGAKHRTKRLARKAHRKGVHGLGYIPFDIAENYEQVSGISGIGFAPAALAAWIAAATPIIAAVSKLLKGMGAGKDETMDLDNIAADSAHEIADNGGTEVQKYRDATDGVVASADALEAETDKNGGGEIAADSDVEDAPEHHGILEMFSGMSTLAKVGVAATGLGVIYLATK